MREVQELGRLQRSRRSSRVRQFSLTSFREAQRTVVRACGRLVLGHGAHEPVWAPHLDQTTATVVALDLSCVNDVDARGLGLLAGLVRRARQRGTTVSVIAASRLVQRLGKMTRLDRALTGAWHERIGVLSCRAVGARPTTVHPAMRESGGGGCDERSAAAWDRAAAARAWNESHARLAYWLYIAGVAVKAFNRLMVRFRSLTAVQ
jgi:ABC-type transporter Mla MlaB component